MTYSLIYTAPKIITVERMEQNTGKMVTVTETYEKGYRFASHLDKEIAEKHLARVLKMGIPAEIIKD